MAPSTDAVVADVRDKRLAIDRRIELLRGRIEKLNPKHAPWQEWSAKVWPLIAMGVAAWLFRSYRYRHRFMRLP